MVLEESDLWLIELPKIGGEKTYKVIKIDKGQKDVEKVHFLNKTFMCLFDFIKF